MIARPRRAACLRSLAMSVVVGGVLGACAPATPESASEPAPRAPRIVIDGTFDDWGPCVGIEDPIDAGSAELDVREVCLAHDSEAVYLRLDLGRAVNAQGLGGILSLALDVDGDPRTGWSGAEPTGIDLIIEFTHADPNDPKRLRYGVRSFVPDPAPTAGPAARPESMAGPDSAVPPESATARGEVDPYALGLFFEPRHTARRIEIRLDRDVRLPGGVRTFLGDRTRGQLSFRDQTGRAIDVTGPFDLALEPWSDPPQAPEGPPSVEDPLARAPGTAFRLLSWNVSRARFLSDPDPFRRILAAVAPDVVLLDEIVPAVTAATVRNVLPAAPGTLPVARDSGPSGRDSVPSRDSWFVHVGSSGSAQRGAIAAHTALEPAVSFARVAYPDSVLPLLTRVSSTDLREVVANATRDGAPTAGAWASLEGRRLLLVTLDLVCCGNRADAIEDRIRRIEASSINAAARRESREAAAAGREADAIVVGGDFNLVASHTPLELAASGLGPDGADLVPVYALQLDGRSSATWDGGWGQFPPGQLDYVLFSAATLVDRRAFVLETRDLDSAWLGRHGLDGADSERASDHRPIVVDFAWRERP